MNATDAQIVSIEERNNRIAKARHIADAVWPHVQALNITDPNLAREAVRMLPQAVRDHAANIAGHSTPSGQTWAIVAGLIAFRIEHPAPDDPFEGLPK